MSLERRGNPPIEQKNSENETFSKASLSWLRVEKLPRPEIIKSASFELPKTQLDLNYLLPQRPR
jgi:hypothetical protein